MIKSQLEDTFEKLVEEGSTAAKKTVKSSVKQVASIASPSKMWEQLLGVSSRDSNLGAESVNAERSRSEVKGNGKHTPLDIEKLSKHYQKNDKQKTELLRQRLFQLVKQGDEKIMYEKKKEAEEKKREEYYKSVDKKKEEDKKRQQSTQEIPKGKVRRSIFSPKKVAERSHAETKPSSGKQ